MKKIHLLVWYISILVACNIQKSKYPGQYKVLNDVLVAMSLNDSAKVKRMIGARLNDVGLDDEKVNQKVSFMKKTIDLCGIPNEKTFVLTEFEKSDPRLVDILVQFMNPQKTSLRKATLTVHFVKYLPQNKILSFEVEGEYDESNAILPVDSIK
jgi:hypothetical protein